MAILATMASWTATALCPSGRCSNITNPLARSTRVRTALLDTVELNRGRFDVTALAQGLHAVPG